MGDNSKKRILEIWEYFVELLPEHEYLQLKRFVEGKFFLKTIFIYSINFV